MKVLVDADGALTPGIRAIRTRFQVPGQFPPAVLAEAAEAASHGLQGYEDRTALPFVPGFEGVGEIARLGTGVSGLAVGQRVLPIGASGLWQEYLVRPAEWCFAVPDDLSDDQAAMAYVNPLTAFGLIDAVEAHFGKAGGQRIGVTAGASAIGRMLLVLLAEAGFHPVAPVRSAATAP